MNRIVLLTAAVIIPCVTHACTFQFDPAANVKYYRSEGWKLPGIADFSSSAPVRDIEQYPVTNIPAARAIPLLHDEYPYVIELPAQTFTLDSAPKRMHPVLALAAILRWEMDGKIFSYSYGLIPVSAHRINGKWKIDSEAGCIFNATFIDESGDGVFRLMVPGSLTESLVPAWVKRPQSD
jgi:hypothetical protein